MNVLFRQIHTRHRHGSDAFFASDEPQVFVGGGFDADTSGIEAEGSGDAGFHFLDVRENLWRLGDNRGIQVDDVAPARCHLTGGFCEKNLAGRTFPAGVCVREKVANVRFAEGPQNRVANRVHQHVRVGMALETFGVRDFNATQHESASGDQGMNVVADACVNHGRRLAWCWVNDEAFHGWVVLNLPLAFRDRRGTERFSMKPHILFVDDEAPIRELVSVYFRKKGYEVATATTGEEAMELADQGPYDVAILDIDLAGENGLELLAYFRTNFPKLPVIMFTGLSGEEDLLQQALARGAHGFMCKTDSLENLLSAVQPYAPKP